ncbi:MAG: GNAT family N-acetyltransferase [Candidatus Binataceae bacterium]|nr:GNAT family N-acetyltransferase [Candidatus Binataceae bacterium]
MQGDNNQQQLFRVRVRNLDAIVAAGLAIERLAIGHGLGPLEASRFRFAIEELCAERLAYAFAPGDEAEAHLTLELRPGELVVVIQDDGSPIDAADTAAGAKGWLAQLLGRNFADSLHASFEGRDGNRCEMAKLLGKSIQSELRNSIEAGSASRAEVEADAKPAIAVKSSAAPSIQYRNMTPADALGVARCFYRTYGFTAPLADEVIYHPEKLAARVDGGLHLGIVAVLPDDRIVGHIAIAREQLSDPVGTSGFLVVDPEFRGHGIADALSDHKPARAREAGIRAFLAMAVTVHTASQKTCLREGGHEVGVLLAAQEDRVVMRGIAPDARHERHAVVPFFTQFDRDRQRESFVPAPYREIVANIFKLCGLDRAICSAPALTLNALPERSELKLSVMEGAAFAKIRVRSYGRDFLREVFHVVDDLHRHHVKLIRLEMPLDDPLSAHFGPATEELGFSFAAIFPAAEAGDLLCVQSLDRIEINPGGIHTASEHGAEVLATVLASRERVLSSSTARTLEGALSALNRAA